MQVYCSIPGNRVDVSVFDESVKRNVRKPIIFESPDKPQELPDELAESFVVTLPKIFSKEPFLVKEIKTEQPVEETQEVKTETPEGQPVPKKKKK